MEHGAWSIKHNADSSEPHTLSPMPLSHVWHLFVVRSKRRDKLQQYLYDNEVQTLIHYPIPPHKQIAFQEWNSLSFPITELIHNTVLSLPISQIMPLKEAERMVEVVNHFKI
jgi:dTDP-4-amino-4,6-dideoxygalactose transaminase